MIRGKEDTNVEERIKCMNQRRNQVGKNAGNAEKQKNPAY